MPRVYTRTDPAIRFLRYVDKGPECWIWTGYRMPNGYGRFDGDTLAHRFAFVQAHGPVPDGKEVCHTCDVRACVNPAHLFAGTRSDNMRDCIGKNRHAAVTAPESFARGEEHVNAVLNEDAVRQIRAGEFSHLTQRQIAARFGVCQATIRDVIHFTTWKHVA